MKLLRYEYKYFIGEELYQQILKSLEAYIEPDQYAAKVPKYRYPVHSLYLDSPSRMYYDEKTAGIKSRRKIRVRCYTENFYSADNYFLELKKKDQDSVTKSRIKMSQEELEYFLEYNFLNSPESFLNGNLNIRETTEEILYYCNRDSLMPTVFVLYEREAYISPFDDTVRLTFDRSVKSYSYYSRLIPDQFNLSPAFNGKVIFEIKLNGLLPIWLHKVIKKFGLFQEAISKYCGGLYSTVVNYS